MIPHAVCSASAEGFGRKPDMTRARLRDLGLCLLQRMRNVLCGYTGKIAPLLGREENETEGKGRMTDIDTNPMSVCDSVIIRENIKAIMSVWY